MRRTTLLLACTLALTLGACSDQALIDRVAQLEASQDRLRASLTELGAPDPDAIAVTEQLTTDVAELSAQAAAIKDALTVLAAAVDEQVLELDGRLTTAELGAADVAATVQQLRSDLTVLTDRVASLVAQLEAHRGDPFGHNG